MVGAMADWFAVTALFRHPLGVPIPHTALIPRRKDMLARSLQDFMGANFLREEIVRERVLAARISERAAGWVLVPRHTERVVDEVISLSIAGLERLEDETVALLLHEAVLPRLREEPVAPIAGTFANLPDGATIKIGNNTFQANYEGGDGNDLTLTVQ